VGTKASLNDFGEYKNLLTLPGIESRSTNSSLSH